MAEMLGGEGITSTGAKQLDADDTLLAQLTIRCVWAFAKSRGWEKMSLHRSEKTGKRNRQPITHW